MFWPLTTSESSSPVSLPLIYSQLLSSFLTVFKHAKFHPATGPLHWCPLFLETPSWKLLPGNFLPCPHGSLFHVVQVSAKISSFGPLYIISLLAGTLSPAVFHFLFLHKMYCYVRSYIFTCPVAYWSDLLTLVCFLVPKTVQNIHVTLSWYTQLIYTKMNKSTVVHSHGAV